MSRQLEHYLKLKMAIQDWILGQGPLSAVATQLNLTSSSLEELLGWNGLADMDGNPEYHIHTQDVFNLLFLAYTQSTRELLRKKGKKG